jgi:hypothetical protein
MARFHINNAGDAGLCRAKQGGCPFGGDDAHFPSIESAREAYEMSMESVSVFGPNSGVKTKPKTPTPEMFISVLNGSQGVMTERRGDDLNDLLPGVYNAQYIDPNTGKDVFIKLTVADDADVSYEETDAFVRLSPATQEKHLKAFDATHKAIHNLATDPVTCAKNGSDRTTLVEAATAVNRIFAKYDLTKASDANLAKADLEDIEWTFEEDLTKAKAQGLAKEIKAIELAKAPLTELLNSLRV